MPTPPIPYRTPSRRNGDIPPGNAIGVGQLPPKKFERGDPVTASQLRDIAEQASRPNQLQRTMPGLSFSTFSGNPEFRMPNLFFEGILLEDMRSSTDPFDDPVVVQMKCIVPLNHKENADQEALSFADNGDEVYIVNRATDISGSEGDRVFCVLISGELRPMGGGGGVTEMIFFETQSFCYGIDFGVGCSCLESVVTRALCSTSVQVGDSVTIWDPDQCWFNLPADLLLGRTGRATLWRRGADGGGASCAQTTQPDPCMWIVDYLCCAEESYA